METGEEPESGVTSTKHGAPGGHKPEPWVDGGFLGDCSGALEAYFAAQQNLAQLLEQLKVCSEATVGGEEQQDCVGLALDVAKAYAAQVNAWNEFARCWGVPGWNG